MSLDVQDDGRRPEEGEEAPVVAQELGVIVQKTGDGVVDVRGSGGVVVLVV